MLIERGQSEMGRGKDLSKQFGQSWRSHDSEDIPHAILIQWIDRIDTPLIIFDSNLNVLNINRYARNTFEENNIDVLLNQRIQFKEEVFYEEINLFLKSDKDNHRKTLIGPNYVWEIQFTKIGTDDNTYIVLSGIRLPNKVHLDLNKFVDQFHLTSAEQSIMMHIVDGRDLKQISELRQRSPETVKSQIKKLYSKIGVKSKVEFLLKIGRFSRGINIYLAMLLI